MRIRDWSSDVCSSDLSIPSNPVWRPPGRRAPVTIGLDPGCGIDPDQVSAAAVPCESPGYDVVDEGVVSVAAAWAAAVARTLREIGRESCRERVGQYV